MIDKSVIDRAKRSGHLSENVTISHDRSELCEDAFLSIEEEKELMDSYTIQIGRFKGRRLSSIDIKELDEYHSTIRKDIPMSNSVKTMELAMRRYLELHQDELDK